MMLSCTSAEAVMGIRAVAPTLIRTASVVSGFGGFNQIAPAEASDVARTP